MRSDAQRAPVAAACLLIEGIEGIEGDEGSKETFKQSLETSQNQFSFPSTLRSLRRFKLDRQAAGALLLNHHVVERGRRVDSGDVARYREPDVHHGTHDEGRRSDLRPRGPSADSYPVIVLPTASTSPSACGGLAPRAADVVLPSARRR